jgi:hypothetical protein
MARKITVKRNTGASTQPHGVMRTLKNPVYTGVKPSGVGTGANPFNPITITANRIAGKY